MNITKHIPISKTAIEMCRRMFEKEDRTTYTDEQILEFMKSARIAGRAREFWKEEEYSQIPQAEWEIKT